MPCPGNVQLVVFELHPVPWHQFIGTSELRMKEASRQCGGVVAPTAMLYNDPSRVPRVQIGVVVLGMWAFSRGGVLYHGEAQQ